MKLIIRDAVNRRLRRYGELSISEEQWERMKMHEKYNPSPKLRLTPVTGTLISYDHTNGTATLRMDSYTPDLVWERVIGIKELNNYVPAETPVAVEEVKKE